MMSRWKVKNVSFMITTTVGQLLGWWWCCLPVAHAFSSSSSSSKRTINQFRQAYRLTSSSSSIVNEDTLNSFSIDATSSSSPSSSNPFANFDYLSHWYPVIWACDLPWKEPTKVTVFDTDYVVAKLSDTEVICLKDKCPHKAAALSQGRVTETGNFQCAYHGWSFHGKTGQCVDIPQITKANNDNKDNNNKGTGGPKIPSRSCADAVPAQIHQEMVWIFPGGNLETALQAPPPPSVPEYDQGFKMTKAVRDIPVDWAILCSNICDPDHGLFAHQMKPFDMYTASKDYPMTTEEEFPNNGKGYILKSKVDAADKILEVDRTWRTTPSTKNKKQRKQQTAKKETPWATSYLQPPYHLQLKRVDKTTNKSKFVSSFYICPIGVGRSRFMSAGVAPKSTPRWITKLFLDNFLDQDSYLLATQQQYILDQEARDVKEMLMMKKAAEATQNKNRSDASSSDSTTTTNKPMVMTTRKKLFCLCSPTEKFGAQLEQFWDATLLQSPNRIERLLQLHNAGAFASTPPREFVLDRKAQNLDICPDSQRVVRNSQRIRRVAKWIGFSTLLMTALSSSKNWTTTLVVSPTAVAMTCVISFGVSWIADKLQREYYFKYTDQMRQKDLKKIPKQIWIDK